LKIDNSAAQCIAGGGGNSGSRHTYIHIHTYVHAYNVALRAAAAAAGNDSGADRRVICCGVKKPVCLNNNLVLKIHAPHKYTNTHTQTQTGSSRAAEQ